MSLNPTLRLYGLENDSIVDGPGFRFSVFVQGCPHHCKGCHNPNSHDFAGGYDESLDSVLEKIKANPLLDGVTFSGGEPFCQAKTLAILGAEIKKLGLNLITYTGYTYEYLKSHATEENGYEELLNVSDYLVDGPFIESEQSYLLHYKGSKNQRFIDLKQTVKSGEITELYTD